jgi:glutathione S-transferase
MSDRYRIFGSELSPYSVKVRSYFRYKKIAHEWVIRSAAVMDEFRRYAKLPLIPLVVTPDDQGLQDSTPILERMETLYPALSIQPPDPALRFLSALIEEYGDEWGNKPMFHYRWFYEPDQESAAERIARDNMPDLDAPTLASVAGSIRERMVPRLSFVGSSPVTRETIEESFMRQLAILERHLAKRPYLLGARPAFADFGVFPQLYQCSTDPTPGALLRGAAPRVLAWIGRMLDPVPAGDFEPWAALAPTLHPLLAEEIGALFLPWSAANARAIGAGAKEFTVELGGRPWAQEPQKYHAKSLAALKGKYAAVSDRTRLDPILAETGCLEWLGA